MKNTIRTTRLNHIEPDFQTRSRLGLCTLRSRIVPSRLKIWPNGVGSLVPARLGGSKFEPFSVLEKSHLVHLITGYSVSYTKTTVVCVLLTINVWNIVV